MIIQIAILVWYVMVLPFSLLIALAGVRIRDNTATVLGCSIVLGILWPAFVVHLLLDNLFLLIDGWRGFK